MISSLTRGPSTLYSNLLRRNANAEIQTRLNQAEQELATGVKSDIYQSLGTSAAEALGLTAARDRDAAQIAANGLLAGRIDSMTTALGAMRSGVQSTFDLAMVNSQPGGATAAGLQIHALTALDALIGQANGTHAGATLFSGTATDSRALTPWSETSAATGQSPAEAIGALLAQGMGDITEVSARISELDALFANATGGFDALFDTGSGGPATAGIGDGEQVRIDARSNDPAFRAVLQGLVMLAATDVTELPDDAAYAAWMETATARLSEGMEGLLDQETRLGSAAGRIEAANTRMQDRALLYNSRVDQLIGVDAYEAATNITALETQLQASYAVTARLSQLSFLNYMG